MAYSGAEILLECLKRENVEIVFGYPGGSVIPIFDEIGKKRYFKFVLPRHEQAATHAADAYARATGKTGVCLVTSGPGATNTITGIATAYLDSIPIVVLSGQVPKSYIGTDAFQEVDMIGIVRPITKHRYLVKSAKDLPRIIKEAFYIASTGRPGPVVVDLPKDVTTEMVAEYVAPEEVNLRGYKPNLEGHPNQIKKLIEEIKVAKKPILYVGGGIKLSNSTKELRAFINKTQIPVTSTLMGLGVVEHDYKYNLEMLGMHGTAYANLAINEADLIVAIGARFDDRVTGNIAAFNPTARIAHVDIDSASIAKIIKVDVPVVGDAKEILAGLNKVVEVSDISNWQKRILELKEKNPMIIQNDGEKLYPQFIVSKISDITNGETMVATDVGQHQMWAAQFYKVRHEKQLLTSGGLGTMGVGVPYGMGAAFALEKEKKPVIVFTGDGGFQMNLQELATISIHNLPVKIFILNNSYLGMVRQWQEFFFDKRYSGTCLRAIDDCMNCKNPDECDKGYVPDFKALAESYSIKAERIKTKGDVEDAVKRAFEHKGPYLIDFIIEQNANVYPMVPAGKGLTEMMRGLA